MHNLPLIICDTPPQNANSLIYTPSCCPRCMYITFFLLWNTTGDFYKNNLSLWVCRGPAIDASKSTQNGRGDNPYDLSL